MVKKKQKILALVIILLALGVSFVYAFFFQEKPIARESLPEVKGFEKFAPSKITFADQKKVVLFFNATWCVTCNEVMLELPTIQIPENILFLSVDFDTESELRKKYGVALQHTFVEVNSSGEMVQKWAGGSLKEAVEKLK